MHLSLSKLPYIIHSRKSCNLKKNLLKKNIPVLFEGIHTTALINDPEINHIPKILRTHNVEHHYYRELFKNEPPGFSKYYYGVESKRLKKYETNLNNPVIAALSKSDTAFFRQYYKEVRYIPIFHPFEKVTSKKGSGDYVLYHGNLSVNENIKAAAYILDEIAVSANIPFILAGKNPHKRIYQKAENLKNVKIVANPGDAEMQELIQNAQINLLPTFQTTGMKLKLLFALFTGRQCIVNKQMTANTGLEDLCFTFDTTNELLTILERCFKEPFQENEIQKRNHILQRDYNNKKGAEKIIKMAGLHD